MFVGSQVRLTLEEDHFYPDLVFYNRILKCFVIIDLKIGKVTHQDIGQMQMYVNYYDREIKSDEENSIKYLQITFTNRTRINWCSRGRKEKFKIKRVIIYKLLVLNKNYFDINWHGIINMVEY